MVIGIIVGLVLLTALLLIGMCYPELLKRPFQPLLDKARPNKSANENKPHKLSHNQILITQLAPGQILRYTIPEKWGGKFLNVEVNPEYPKNGKKYIISIEKAHNGLPSGDKNVIDESDDPVEIDKSISDREGELYGIPKGMPAGEKQKEPVGAR